MEDPFDLYEGLDEFQQKQENRNRELQIVEDKYQDALQQIQQLQSENRSLKKDIKQMELNFQTLLDTARAEIRRKDNEIAELRRLKDDMCFRRLQARIVRENSDKKCSEMSGALQEPVAVFNGQHANVLVESRNSNHKRSSSRETKESSANRQKYSPERKTSRSRKEKQEIRSSRDNSESHRREERDKKEHYRRNESERKSSSDRRHRDDRRDVSRKYRS